TLGHDIGDTLLVEAARRISSCVRASDTVARLGGDEFVILLASLEELDCVERIARTLVSTLVEPFLLANEQAYISASIGIALYPNDAQEIDDLLKHADQAMYSSKNAGRNRHSYFAPEMQQAAQLRRRMTNDLRGALEAQQMRVHYQPIVELATGSIHKAEALVRWQHPVRGLVSPADFIPLAEETGLINEIGDWVFRESARQVAHLRQIHHCNFQISVNKSPVQFRKDGGPTKAWFRYLQELGLTGQSMVIEITEGLLMNVEHNVTEKLLAFRDAGMQVSLDDFGTGYSSLSYLKKFDIDYLKIDKTFVSNLESDPDNLTLCESIIVMAHKLGLKVIAEGVETEAQRDLLAHAGCDYAQGFFFSGPVAATEFEEFLLAWSKVYQGSNNAINNCG
ncbi:MAG: EAL domain-containing protein, partial [Burkholderiales bacterium]|nr:EAL domain-containing protein [Burkholderiales bacterium]